MAEEETSVCFPQLPSSFCPALPPRGAASGSAGSSSRPAGGPGELGSPKATQGISRADRQSAARSVGASARSLDPTSHSSRWHWTRINSHTQRHRGDGGASAPRLNTQVWCSLTQDSRLFPWGRWRAKHFPQEAHSYFPRLSITWRLLGGAELRQVSSKSLVSL